MDRIERIRDNFTEVQKKIVSAAKKTGRDAADIKIVVASKYSTSAKELILLNSLGIEAFGENKQQGLEIKNSLLLSKGVKANWHFIGHLQSNKAKKVVTIVDLIQSVDSLKLASKIDRIAGSIKKRQKILLQLKLSEEPLRVGISERDIRRVCYEAVEMPNVKIEGIMFMAPFEDSEKLRYLFKKVRNTLISLQSSYNIGNILSMGMTNDYEVAIEEGSNMVRIGSAFWR